MINSPDEQDDTETPAVDGLRVRPRPGRLQYLRGEVVRSATERLQHRISINELGHAEISHLHRPYDTTRDSCLMTGVLLSPSNADRTRKEGKNTET